VSAAANQTPQYQTPFNANSGFQLHSEVRQYETSL
jgi:hypothetical protein